MNIGAESSLPVGEIEARDLWTGASPGTPGRPANRALRTIGGVFGVMEIVLRSRVGYFDQLARGEALPAKAGRLLAVVALGLGSFGLVAGLSGNDAGQALLSAVKLPLLFLASGAITLPTLYYFSVLFGSRLSFTHNAMLVLTVLAVTGILALGFAPISFLFWMSQADPMFLVLLNMVFLALSAALSLFYLVQGILYLQETAPPAKINLFTWVGWFFKNGLRSLVVVGWMVLYAATGAQMSWLLRPFFGVPLSGTSFASSISNLLLHLLGR